MNEDRFWQVIADCNLREFDVEEWGSQLAAALKRLPPDEIIEWNHIFDRFAAAAYTADLIAACCLINTGAGSDGFYYFRCWLIGMGRSVYEAAVQNADSLADTVMDFVNPRRDAEAEIYWAAHHAWMAVTGQPDTAHYPARNEAAEFKGEDWDTESRPLRRKRLPRLSALYGE